MLRIDILIAVIATIAGIYLLAKYKLKYLLTFFLISLIAESIGFYLSNEKRNNVLIFNLYSVFQFIYILNIYTKFHQEKILKSLLITIPLICLINIFFIQGPKTFHTYSFMLGALIIIAVSIFHLWSLFNLGKVDNILKNSSFWFAIGFLLYFTGSLSIIGVFNYIATLPKYFINLSRNLLVSVNTITYILLLLSMIFFKSSGLHRN